MSNWLLYAIEIIENLENHVSEYKIIDDLKLEMIEFTNDAI